MSRIDRVGEAVGREELLVLLAEEADELAHAALKLRRVLTGQNPTPVGLKEAKENVLEELADVSLCLLALNLDTGLNRLRIRTIMEQKLDRWEQRLDEADRTKGGQAST